MSSLHNLFETSSITCDEPSIPKSNVPTRKLDVFKLLKETDKQNYEHFQNLSEDEQKEFSPWVIQRWLSSQKLELVSEITNPLINNIPKSMAYRLFCAIGFPGNRRYSWNKPPKKISGIKSDLVLSIVANHYGISSRVAKTYIPLLSNDHIIEFAIQDNFDKKQLTALKKTLRAKSGKKT